MSITHVIKSEDEYKTKLKQVSHYMDNPPIQGSDELDLLCLLIMDYEAKHYPLEAPTPAAMIDYSIERLGYDLAQLEKETGLNYSQIANIRRGAGFVTLTDIRKLARGLDIDIKAIVS
jgi:HTH-type transcriptional regulator/antitoxin HigA